jgi:hypothetical protein
VEKGKLFGKVATAARTSLTLVALLGIGLAALVRLKPKEPRKDRLPIDSWVERGDTLRSPAPPEPKKTKRRRGRGRRRLGKVLIVLGIALVGYSAAIVFWGDPATALYAR